MGDTRTGSAVRRFYCDQEEAAEQVAVASVMGDVENVALPLIANGMCHYIREVDENGKTQDPVPVAILYVGRIFSDQFVVIGFEYDNALRYAVMPVHTDRQRVGSI